MKNELIQKLHELRQLAEEAFVQSVQQPRMSNHYYIGEIMKTPGLDSNEKLVLIDMILNQKYNKNNTVKGTVGQENTGLGRVLYNNATRRLTQKGYIKVISRGYYQINQVF